jgi:hypothetical protein
MKSILELTLVQRRELFVAPSQKLGYTAPVVEKDFWVCWALRELFALPGGDDCIWIHGTLRAAHDLIRVHLDQPVQASVLRPIQNGRRCFPNSCLRSNELPQGGYRCADGLCAMIGEAVPKQPGRFLPTLAYSSRCETSHHRVAHGNQPKCFRPL